MPRKKIVGGASLPIVETSPVASWTVGRYRAFVTSVVRGGFRRFPNKFVVLKNAFVGKFINKKTGRDAAHYVCASCGKQYVAKDVQVDHISPVVSSTEGFVSWDRFIERLYCDVSNLQVLCTSCHKEKTASERSVKCTTTTKTVRKKKATTTGQYVNSKI